jgi:LCP family protein required for cell wall assembly
VHRMGIRTDSMILASLDVHTGRTVMFSLPRNMMNARFPRHTPLHRLYPRGFRGRGDDGNWMLNAVYRMVPLLHPGALGKSDNEGADALKMAVEGTLGTRVDYYLLVNLAGFREIVNAMGGVTVNINEPIPIGGNTDLGVPPDSYLQPAAHKRLNGQQALWFSRGRYGSNDYARMDRQRCMVNAIIDEAKPVTLLRRYQALAAAGKRILRTDIPNTLLPAFVDLSQKVKGASVTSVVFRPSKHFTSADPDFAWMHSVVRKALAPPQSSQPSGSPSPSAGGSLSASPSSPSSSPSASPSTALNGKPSGSASDPCAYHPVQ